MTRMQHSGSARALAGGVLGGTAAALVALLGAWAIVRWRPSGMQMLVGAGSGFVMATALAAGLGAPPTGRIVPTALGVVAGEAILATALLVLDNRLSTFPGASTRSEALGYGLVLLLTLITVVGGGAALAGAAIGQRGRSG
mgnify:CR=1 FL=1